MKNLLAIIQEPYKVNFIERDIPDLKQDEVLIKIRSSAICGSDIHIYKGKHPSVILPSTIGHELSGDIVGLGTEVKEFRIGERVTFEPLINCTHCVECKMGNYSYCENVNFAYRMGDGALAKYIIGKANHVFRIPDRLSYDVGALIEPLSVAIHAVRRADVKLGDSVAIIGGGTIGILIAAVCARVGAGIVLISDLSDFRLQKAIEMGATHAINSQIDDVVKFSRKLTNNLGMDKTFECVGLETTFTQAFSLLRKNGLMTVVGIYEQPQIMINVANFVNDEVRVQGSQGYCWDFPIAINMAKHIPLEKLITHHFNLSELQSAFDVIVNKSIDSIKIIVNP